MPESKWWRRLSVQAYRLECDGLAAYGNGQHRQEVILVFHNHSEPDPAAARTAWAKAFEASRPHLRNCAIVDVLAASSGWIDTGLDLKEGEEARAGMVWLAEELGIGVNGGVALWHRIGTGGPIAKAIGTTTSFRAERNGRLMLIAKPPGEWRDSTGRFEPDYPHAGATGALTVAILVWLVQPGTDWRNSGQSTRAVLPHGRLRGSTPALAAHVAAWRDPDFSRGGWRFATRADLLSYRARRRHSAISGRCRARPLDAAHLGLAGR
jgi:hypothetical protein